MKEINTSIEINASKSKVWNILTDFTQYSTWNPFITHVAGRLVEGKTLSIHVKPPSKKPMRFQPTLLTVKNHEKLRWLGKLPIPGFFSGEHVFEIHPINDTRVRFVQREQFKGCLVPFLWKSLNSHTRRGFMQMNSALKIQAENF